MGVERLTVPSQSTALCASQPAAATAPPAHLRPTDSARATANSRGQQRGRVQEWRLVGVGAHACGDHASAHVGLWGAFDGGLAHRFGMVSAHRELRARTLPIVERASVPGSAGRPSDNDWLRPASEEANAERSTLLRACWVGCPLSSRSAPALRRPWSASWQRPKVVRDFWKIVSGR